MRSKPIVRACAYFWGALFLALSLATAGGAGEPPKEEVVPQTAIAGRVFLTVFSPDGARVLSVGEFGDRPKLWDTATGKLICSFDVGPVRATGAAFSPDGRRIVFDAGRRGLQLSDAETCKPIRDFGGLDIYLTRLHIIRLPEVVTVAFSPDGGRILAGATHGVPPINDSLLNLWDAATGAHLMRFEGHGSDVRTVAFSPDGTQVLSGSADKTVRLWDAATGKLIRTFERHRDAVVSAAFSPDGGRILSVGADGAAKVWDAATGRLLHAFATRGLWVKKGAFTADGPRVLSDGAGGALNLWEPRQGKLIRSFDGGGEAVYSAALSSDGTRVLLGSDGSMSLLDTTSGRLIRSFSER